MIINSVGISVLKITTTNDGKCKHRSWTAELEDIIGTHECIGSDVYVAAGYGATEEEAIADLKNNIRELWLCFSKVVSETMIG